MESAEWYRSRIIKMFLFLAVLENGRTEKKAKRGNLRPILDSFVMYIHVHVYLFLVSPVAIFRTGFSFVEYCSGSFRSFIQSDY